MRGPIARIAFVAEVKSANNRRLASGLSRFAKPSRGYIVREFFIPEDVKELPQSFRSWSADAVVSHVLGPDFSVLDALASQGPVVNTARVQPLPNRAVVLGDAEELYRLVHAHFRENGVNEIAQFAVKGPPGTYSTRERYRRFCETEGIPFHSFSTADPEECLDAIKLVRPDETIAQWLTRLNRPVGVFSQCSFAGSYLCRTCELLGIAVPGDVAVIGSDGFDIALTSQPLLTTIQVPSEAIGYEAGKMAAAMLAGTPAPTDIVTVRGARLIVRASTCSPLRSECNVDAAMDFINQHAGDGIRVNDVVSHTQGVSRMTFHKRFVEAFGVTPGAAIKERQLVEARRLLAETQLSLGTVAGMCGYIDYMHFYHVIRESEGVGPRDYRRAALGD